MEDQAKFVDDEAIEPIAWTYEIGIRYRRGMDLSWKPTLSFSMPVTDSCPVRNVKPLYDVPPKQAEARRAALLECADICSRTVSDEAHHQIMKLVREMDGIKAPSEEAKRDMKRSRVFFMEGNPDKPNDRISETFRSPLGAPSVVFGSNAYSMSGDWFLPRRETAPDQTAALERLRKENEALRALVAVYVQAAEDDMEEDE